MALGITFNGQELIKFSVKEIILFLEVFLLLI